MKNLLIALTVYFSAIGLVRAEECKETTSSSEVVHKVNKDIPKHLQGAVIIVRQADGRETAVPAEKFMVVPRTQYTVIGENKTVKRTCSKDVKKNIVMVEAERDIDDLEVVKSNNNKTAQVDSTKSLTPGINYYRRQILDSDLGIGAGVDSNGTVKGMIGLDF